MTRFILRRVLLSLVTLWLLATIVFFITNVLPNDVGRTILGPFAPQESVDTLNEQLGTNDPLIEQYLRAMRNLVTLDFGNSFVSNQPVMPTLLAAIGRSAQLATLALILTVPISIVAGMFAARRRDRATDRAIVLAGVTTSSIPEFVTATFLVVVVSVPLRHLPGHRPPPPDSDLLTTLRYLFLPAVAMAIVYFGYIARMARAGTIESLNSDYVRTAEMKGLSTSQVMRRHVLRNALVPTVAVVAVQIGYLFGGIIGVEKIFNYNGMGQLMLFSAQRKDIPMLTAGVLAIGIVYMVATLDRRPRHGLDEPADPTGCGALMASPAPWTRRPRPLPRRRRGSERAQARREIRRLLFRRPGFVIGLVIVVFWLICTVAAERFVPYDPFNDYFLGHQPPSLEHWFGTDRSGVTCSRGSSSVPATCSSWRRRRRSSASSPGRSSA